MIKNLEIKNFKSIKHLKLDCKRINIFIGKPNTGKSNILESMGVLSAVFAFSNLKDFVRFKHMDNLFYNNELTEQINITANDISFKYKFENEKFKGTAERNEEEFFHCEYDYKGGGGGWGGSKPLSSPFRFYRFEMIDKFPKKEFSFLMPTKGENLLSILSTNRASRKLASDLFSNFGLKIVLKSPEGIIEVEKEIEENVVVPLPYSLVSDTLQRIIFHLIAIESNKDSVIVFEEPEAHAFPYYTKFLAERIALDETNQYFISTHNPYFLLSILEKAPKDNIGIYITYLKKYQTKVKSIPKDKLSEILDLGASLFFNIDKFLEED